MSHREPVVEKINRHKLARLLIGEALNVDSTDSVLKKTLEDLIAISEAEHEDICYHSIREASSCLCGKQIARNFLEVIRLARFAKP